MIFKNIALFFSFKLIKLRSHVFPFCKRTSQLKLIFTMCETIKRIKLLDVKLWKDGLQIPVNKLKISFGKWL